MSRPTPAQDRQARGLPPLNQAQHQPHSNSKGKGRAVSSGNSRGGAGLNPSDGRDDTSATKNKGMLDAQGYDEKQRRDRAARILGSWEMLAWHGISNGESLPQTRLRFEKSLIGLQDSSEGEDADEWEDAFSDDSGSDSDDEGGRDRSEGAENNHSKGKGNKKDSTTTTRKQQEGNKNRDKDKDKDKKNKKEAGRRGR